MEYIRTVMERAIAVQSIISVHYYEYPIDFFFAGEVHDFWELVYADKGEAIITAGNRELALPAGSLFLHKPMEYHNIRCGKSGTVNSFIISFSCDCPSLYTLAGRPIPCGERERERMAEIVVEAKNAFSSPLDDVIVPQLKRRENAAFGSEQMVQLYLEQILIGLIRHHRHQQPEEPLLLRAMQESKGDALLQGVCSYLEKHVADNVTMEQLCQEFCVSKSTLQKLFQSRVGYGISRYYQELKISRAKILIREKRHNFTEIAQMLGYSSVHYFSRHFKQMSGMTPSEYVASLQAMLPAQADG